MSSGKRWAKWVQILPLVFAANSAAVANSTTTNFRIQGNAVTALFEAPTSADGCVLTLLSIAAADLVEKLTANGNTTSVRATVTVIQFDICNEILLFNADGESTNIALRIAGNLSSASLTATVLVFDNVFQGSHTLELNVTWRASAKPEFTNTKETFKDPELGITIKAKSRSMLAEATATGTVMGLGQNLTPEASEDATIQKNADSALTIEKVQ